MEHSKAIQSHETNRLAKAPHRRTYSLCISLICGQLDRSACRHQSVELRGGPIFTRQTARRIHSLPPKFQPPRNLHPSSLNQGDFVPDSQYFPAEATISAHDMFVKNESTGEIVPIKSKNGIRSYQPVLFGSARFSQTILRVIAHLLRNQLFPHGQKDAVVSTESKQRDPGRKPSRFGGPKFARD